MMKRRDFLKNSAAFGAVTMVGVGGATYKARAAEEIVLGIMTSADDPFTLGAQRFAEIVREESGGDIDVNIFTDGVLGSEAEMYDGMERGTVDAIVTSPGNFSFIPDYQLLDLPFLFRDEAHRDRVIDGEVGERFNDIFEEQAGIVVLGNFDGSIRNLISRDVNVRTLEDAQNLRMRVWQSQVIIDTWEALGTNPTVVAYAEVYTALQAGVVDAAENEPPTLINQNWYEPCTAISLTQHSHTIRPLVISRSRFDSLNEAQQELLLDAGRRAAEYEVELERNFGDEALARMRDQYGLELLEVTDREAWIERTEPVRRRMAESVDALDLLEAVQDA